MIKLPTEKNGVYRFECGKEIYEYRTENKREYTNEEFVKFIKGSLNNSSYYNEPSTTYNDYDGDLIMYPRNSNEDKKFLDSVLVILEHTKSNEKRELINKILNKCLIIDEEPTYKSDADNSYEYNKLSYNLKEVGLCHIDRYALNDIYRDSINYAAHKYIKKYNWKGHYNKEEEKSMELLIKLD